jgi:predicted PurR-regulated permease PerM
MRLCIIVILLTISFFINNLCLANESKNSTDLVYNKFNKIISEYKAYLETIPKQTQESVINYRNKINALEEQKQKIYQELAPSTKNHLKMENLFKKRLPKNNNEFLIFKKKLLQELKSNK